MGFLSSKQISLVRENPYIYKGHQDQNSSAARLQAQTRPVEIRNLAFFNGNLLDGKYTHSSCSYEQVSSMAIIHGSLVIYLIFMKGKSYSGF
jgi:hypothetical protein